MAHSSTQLLWQHVYEISLIPCTPQAPSFLPPELASQLLASLQQDAGSWGQMQWWMPGKEGQSTQATSSKRSCHYMLSGEAGGAAPQARLPLLPCTHDMACMQLSRLS